MTDKGKVIVELIAEGHSKRTIANALNDDYCQRNGWDPAEAHQLLLDLWEEGLRRLSPELQGLLEKGTTMSKTDTWPPEYEFNWDEHDGSVRVPLAKVKSRAYVHNMMWGRWDESPLEGMSQKEWPRVMEEWRGSGFSGTIDTGGADVVGRLIQGLWGWFKQRDEAAAFSDAESGCYILAINKEVESYLFLVTPSLLAYLKRWTGKEVTPANLESHLRAVGLRAGYKEVNPVRVGKEGKQYRGFWAIPVDVVRSHIASEDTGEQQGSLMGGSDGEVLDI